MPKASLMGIQAKNISLAVVGALPPVTKQGTKEEPMTMPEMTNNWKSFRTLGL